MSGCAFGTPAGNLYIAVSDPHNRTGQPGPKGLDTFLTITTREIVRILALPVIVVMAAATAYAASDGTSVGPAEPPVATPAAATAAAPPSATTCEGHPGALGVSRIIEIDTTGGPKFGRQYHDVAPLEDKEVVLTFDDGPARRYTIPILDALDAECVKATFFSVGRMALGDPSTIKEVLRRGHTIGSHTWSHKKLPSVPAAKAEDEIEMGVSAVAAALGQPVAPFFRFPYLTDTAAMRKYLAERDIADGSCVGVLPPSGRAALWAREGLRSTTPTENANTSGVHACVLNGLVW